VREGAVETLGRIGDARALPDLKRLAREGKDKSVYKTALNAIARIRACIEAK